MEKLENMVFGPGDDNYGRDKSPLRALLKTEKMMDQCVNCGKETPYSRDLHIDYRLYYIEGAGQLCKDCYDQIYTIKNVSKDISSD